MMDKQDLDQDGAATVSSADEPEAEAFHIHNADTANWVVRRLAAAVAYEARVKAWADAEIRRAEREAEWFRRRFGAELEAWTREEIHKFKGRKKSIHLPAGTVGFRRLGPKLVIDDAAAVLAWAKVHHPKAIVMLPKLDKAMLNKLFEEAAEVPDAGAHVEPEGEKFFVR
jgi:phage host-nuclease inhibitor protein Gam